MQLANAIDAIPYVATTAQRTALYPAPNVGQRVQNAETGAIERWTGSAWVITQAVPGTVVDVRQYGAVGDGVTNDLPAFVLALGALNTLGGGRLVANGVFKFGDGYSEPGSFLSVNVSDVVCDFSGAEFIGNVIVGDLANPATCPTNVTIIGGTYRPDTTGAPSNSGRYFSYSNACGIASGKDVEFLGPRCVAMAYVRGFSIQTDNTYTGNGGVPIENVTVVGLEITCAANTPDGLDISSAGADGLIRNVRVSGRVTGAPRRGVSVSSGGAPWRVDQVTLDMDVYGSVDFAAQLYYLRRSDITIRASQCAWRGFDITEPTTTHFNLTAHAASTQNPTSPPSGSGFSNNTNYGCSVAGTDATICVVSFRSSGPFYNGLLPTRSATLYPVVAIEGTSNTALVSGNYGHVFDRVVLKAVGGNPAMNGADEVYRDVRVYNDTDDFWEQINPLDFGLGEQIFRTANRTNNNGGFYRVRPVATGSGVGGAAYDVGQGGMGFTETYRMESNGTNPRISWFGVTPAVRAAAIPDATGGATIDAEARTAINALLAAMRTYGLLST